MSQTPSAEADEEKVDALVSAGMDASLALAGELEIDADDEMAVRIADELRDHLSCLECSETLTDALANLRAALKVIDDAPYKLRRSMTDCKRALRDGLEEAGVE